MDVQAGDPAAEAGQRCLELGFEPPGQVVTAWTFLSVVIWICTS
ncbi:hypothetical protein ACGFMK_24740 [Amycolatopsis sp. NPDC049252]